MKKLIKAALVATVAGSMLMVPAGSASAALVSGIHTCKSPNVVVTTGTATNTVLVVSGMFGGTSYAPAGVAASRTIRSFANKAAWKVQSPQPILKAYNECL